MKIDMVILDMELRELKGWDTFEGENCLDECHNLKTAIKDDFPQPQYRTLIFKDNEANKKEVDIMLGITK